MNLISEQLQETSLELFSKEFSSLTRNEMYISIATLVQHLASKEIQNTSEKVNDQKLKKLYYFSMEFLMGRLLSNNLENMHLMEEFDEVLEPYGISIKDIEFEEEDAGLGNGGLGRLAACFMDSIASCNYPGYGITLRYRHGFFKQTFKNNEQIELPDLWLNNRNVWENSITDDCVMVSFYGDLVKQKNNHYKLENTIDVLAKPYDMPIVGASHSATTLRMYDVLPLENQADFLNYEKELMDITRCLYPDDSTRKGKELRLKQQYLFVSAGAQNIIKHHMEEYKTLDNLDEYNVMQINDTHPTLLIPELIRIMMDDYAYSFDKAYAITNKCIAYTNHTILSEALETWSIDLLQPLLPRIFQIIEMIDNVFLDSLKAYNYSKEQIKKMAILGDKKVRMANLAIIGSFSVNGVAALHTKILKETEMKIWDEHYPNKFNNKTNGITHRRWFHYSNPKLSELIGKHTNISKEDTIEWFTSFLSQKDNPEVLNQLAQIKMNNKLQLKHFIKDKEGIELNEHAIFDIQIKRLHAYKRQLLNIFHIIYLYQQLKENPKFKEQFHPQTFIFGAKAASGYVLAKNTIKLIKTLEGIINNDSDVNDKLQIIMVTNYNVSYAEKLIPAADISEQISTAGFEASGTGNMKFMMNGAITLGTMDGANVEIHGLVGHEHMEIFGLRKDDVFKIHNDKKRDTKAIIKTSNDLVRIVSFIKELSKDDEFEPIIEYLFKEKDYYLVLDDFEAYKIAQAKLNELYKNQELWPKISLVNIAKSGYFSSDRTIKEYVDDIWHLKPIQY